MTKHDSLKRGAPSTSGMTKTALDDALALADRLYDDFAKQGLNTGVCAFAMTILVARIVRNIASDHEEAVHCARLFGEGLIKWINETHANMPNLH